MDSGQCPSAFICIVNWKFLIEMYNNRQHFLLSGQCFVQRPQYVTLSSTSWSQASIWCKIFIQMIFDKNQAGTVLIGPQPWKHRVNLFDSFPIIVTNRRRGFSGCFARRFWMYTLNDRFIKILRNIPTVPELTCMPVLSPPQSTWDPSRERPGKKFGE